MTLSRRSLIKSLIGAAATLPLPVKRMLPTPAPKYLEPFGKIRVFDKTGNVLTEMLLKSDPFKGTKIAEPTTVMKTGIAAYAKLVDVRGKKPHDVTIGTQGAMINLNTLCLPAGASFSMPSVQIYDEVLEEEC